MKSTNAWLALGILVCAGYFAWLIFFSNRYQTLCQVHYWEATPSQVAACDDMKSELERK